ncbi:MAG: class I SAM-dependent methyltransferase [Proteobacteria bacterium]|nr:class I SAM-dependent methyltransferase [Pseudomonadota bacterium]
MGNGAEHNREHILVDKNAPGTQEKVLSILKTMPPGRLLDAPAGEGALSQKLSSSHDVVAVDIDEHYYKLTGIPFKKVDLNKELPFENDSFDYVVSIEGIEHLENPFLCVREFARVLRPEGSLIITTPNIMSIKSRTRFFFYSYYDFFRFISLDKAFRHGLPEYEHQHINPMTFMELRYAMQKAGLKIAGIHTNRYVKAKRLGILYPVIKSLIISLTRKKAPNDKYLVSKELFEGEILIIHARKGN